MLSSGISATFYWDSDGTTTTGVGGSGTWDTASSVWRSGSEIGTLTTFSSVDTSDVFLTGTAGTLTLASNITLHQLTIGGTSGTYTITGNTLVFPSQNVEGLQGSIFVSSTNSAVIASGIDLGTSDKVFGLDVADGTAENDLVISGQITGSTAIAKTGSGKAVFSNSNNTYFGATTVNAGTLQIDGVIASAVMVNAGATLSGTGSVSKAITIMGLGALRPGNKTPSGSGLGIFTLSGTGTDGNLTVASTGLLDLQLNANGIAFANQSTSVYTSPGVLNSSYTILGNRVAGANDLIVVSGALILTAGATIEVTLNGYTPTHGDAFDLFDWTTFTQGSFTIGPGSNIRTGADNAFYDLKLPDLTSFGNNWNVSLFASDGILVVVPEPSRAILLMAGLSACFLRRRRQVG